MLFCPFTRCLLSQVKRRRPSVQLLCITFLFTCSLAHALAFWCWTGKTLLTADPFKVIEKAGAWFFNVEAYKTNKRNHEESICTVAEGTILPFSHTGRWACATTQRTGFGSVLVLNHLCVLSDPVQTDSCPYEPQQNSLTAVTCADCLRYPWEATSKLEGPGATLPHPAPCMSLTRESIEELLRQLHAAQCSTKGWLTPY